MGTLEVCKECRKSDVIKLNYDKPSCCCNCGKELEKISPDECEHPTLRAENPRITDDNYAESVTIQYDMFCENCYKKVCTERRTYVEA